MTGIDLVRAGRLLSFLDRHGMLQQYALENQALVRAEPFPIKTEEAALLYKQSVTRFLIKTGGVKLVEQFKSEDQAGVRPQ